MYNQNSKNHLWLLHLLLHHHLHCPFYPKIFLNLCISLINILVLIFPKTKIVFYYLLF